MRYLSSAQASEYLKNRYGLSRTARTLANLRSKGGGPKYNRVSQKEIVYPIEELDAWANELLSGSH